MAQSLSESHLLTPRILIWHRYDASVKAELFASALKTDRGILFIDPIWLDLDSLGRFVADQKVIGVVVTNGNHEREAVTIAARFSVAVFAHPAAAISHSVPLADDTLVSGLTILPIEGAAPGEIALHGNDAGGTLVIGDAIINSGSYGFSLLPAKYSSNPKLMRKSLRKLLVLSFERILFAHGRPIVANAHARLTALFEEAK